MATRGSSGGASQFRISHNNGPIDALFIKRSLSAAHHLPKSWQTKAPYHDDHYLTPPNQAGQHGGQSQFNIINNSYTYWAGGVLNFSRDAGVAVPAGSARNTQFAGYDSVQQIQVKYGSQLIWSMPGEEFVWIHHHRMITEHQNAVANLVAGPRTPAQRAADFLVANEYFFEVPFPWESESNPLPMATGSDILVIVSWRGVNELVEAVNPAAPPTSVTKPLTVGSQGFFFKGIQVPQDESLALQSMANSASGIMQMMNDVFVIKADADQQLGPGDQIFQIPLTSLNRPVRTIVAVVQLASDLDTAFNRNPYDGRGGEDDPEITCSITGCGDTTGTIKADVPPAVRVWDDIRRETQPRNDALFKINFCKRPQNNKAFSGSFNFGSTNNAQFRIGLRDSLSRIVRVTLYCEVLNVSQVVQGQLRNLFA